MTQRLEIEVGLSRDAAVDSARRLRAELKGLNEGVVNDARVTSQAETELHKKARDERVRLIKQTAEDSEAAYKRSGEAGKASFASIAASASGALAVIGAMTSAMKAYGDMVDDVRRRESARAKGTIAALESNRELASLMGKPADAAFLKRQSAERLFTLQSQTEAISYNKALMDGGAQFVGRNLTAEQDETARKRVAAYSVARGLSPDAAGTLLGRIYGARDWRNEDPAKIVEEFGATAAQLSAGSGDASHLAKETARVMATLSNDDAMRGRIRGPAAAARAVSLAAEFAPGEESSSVRALARGLFDESDKRSAGLRKAANIGQTDDLETALEKIIPVIKAESQKRGVPVPTIVGESFSDELVRTALSGATTAVEAGVLDQRRGVEREARRPGAMRDVLTEFRASLPGAARMGAVRDEVDELARGLKSAPVELLEQRARLQAKSKLENPTSRAMALGIKVGTFGAIDAEQEYIDRLMMRNLAASAPEEMREELLGTSVPTDPKMRMDVFSRMIHKVSEAGGDPLGGGQAVVRELQEMNQGIKALNEPARPTPRPLVEAPPAQRR